MNNLITNVISLINKQGLYAHLIYLKVKHNVHSRKSNAVLEYD